MEQLIKYLYKIEAVKRGDFTLSSGRKSDIYIDARKAALTPDGVILMAQHIDHILSLSDNFNSIGCVEGVGSLLILGALMGYLGDTPDSFVIRKAQKDHGTKSMIEGTVGERPILIDDVATSGGSLLHAVKYMPVKPIMAIVVLDRQEGATEALAEVGVILKPIITMKDLRDFES